MARDSLAPPVRAGGPSFRALAYLIGGCVLVLAAVLLPGRETGNLNGLRAILLGGGLLTLGIAVARRLQTAPQNLESRIVTASWLLTSCFAVCLAYVATPNRVFAETALPDGFPEHEWDSARMVLMALGIVSLGGTGLVLLPMVARKVAGSALVLAHFSSICVSITSVPPPTGPAPWLSVQAWGYVFRPYASFMYLNNAYHFYSPEPGPPTLVWFFVRYSDDSGRWIKLPSRKDSPVPIHFQRTLALTESVNVINHNTPPNFNELAAARRLAGKIYDPEIPLPLDAPPTVAYQPPEEYSRVMVSAYARYVAKHWPHPDDNPSATVTTVKAYRLIHQIPNAPAIAAGAVPDDAVWDLPYFMGEFDPTGRMIDEHDPFLYFWLPIREEPAGNATGDEQPSGRGVLRNYLEIHATGRSSAKEPQP
jgi:hypothetical protein